MSKSVLWPLWVLKWPFWAGPSTALCAVLALAALVRQPLGDSALNTDEYPHGLVLSLVETTN